MMPCTLLADPSDESILAVLRLDPLWAAYGLCDLEPCMRRHCRWHLAAIEGVPKACVQFFTAFELPDLFVYGDPRAVPPILETIDLPPSVYAHVHLDHEALVRPLYRWVNLRPFKRMVVTADDFRPVGTAVERLWSGDQAEVAAFYEAHPGSFFLPAMLEHGPYFCVRDRGRIVSIAGVHVVSRTHGLGNLGNVSTDPGFRRRGHGAACVNAVVAALFADGYRHVFLNVESANAPAIHLYERLGFRTHCTYLEGVGHRVGGPVPSEGVSLHG